jgi:CBS domain-containing protein
MNPNLPIASIMSKSPYTVKPSIKIFEIKTIFDHFDFHHLPVVENGKIIGIVSKLDCLNYYKKLSGTSTGKNFAYISDSNTRAQDIMSTDLTILQPKDTIGLAADIFLANKFHSIPVVEGEKLEGILTNHDLIEYAFKNNL